MISKYVGFEIKNEYDRQFESIIQYIMDHSIDDILLNIIKAVNNIKAQDYNVYNAFVQYFAKYPLWGTLNPELGDFTTLRLRAEVLKNHVDDFIWLYVRLGDYLSKRTLIAILANWAYMDTGYLARIKSVFRDYWEPDFFQNNDNDVLVDVGAFVGDSILSYVESYGMNYKKIYAYEITPSVCDELRRNMNKASLHDVVIRNKGVGSSNCKMFIDNNAQDSSANKLSENGKVSIDIVKLDDDLDDIPTFIKMDIEGAEKDALKGAERIIRDYSPKLAICTYHGYDDIWMIPRLIDKMNSNYKFYMRHNGGDLIPTEFVLLCVPIK